MPGPDQDRFGGFNVLEAARAVGFEQLSSGSSVLVYEISHAVGSLRFKLMLAPESQRLEVTRMGSDDPSVGEIEHLWNYDVRDRAAIGISLDQDGKLLRFRSMVGYPAGFNSPIIHSGRVESGEGAKVYKVGWDFADQKQETASLALVHSLRGEGAELVRIGGAEERAQWAQRLSHPPTVRPFETLKSWLGLEVDVSSFSNPFKT